MTLVEIYVPVQFCRPTQKPGERLMSTSEVPCGATADLYSGLALSVLAK